MPAYFTIKKERAARKLIKSISDQLLREEKRHRAHKIYFFIHPQERKKNNIANYVYRLWHYSHVMSIALKNLEIFSQRNNKLPI